MRKAKVVTIQENPIPQPRPRVTRWGTFDPIKEKKLWWKSIIAQQFTEKLSCPVEIDFTFHMKIPKSTSKKKKELMALGEIKHTKKPDIDNLIIGMLNSMTDVVYEDDNQVYKISAGKVYSNIPRTEITISWEE